MPRRMRWEPGKAKEEALARERENRSREERRARRERVIQERQERLDAIGARLSPDVPTKIIELLDDTDLEVSQYWRGEVPEGLGVSWGIVMSLSNNDPALLNQSNFSTMLSDLEDTDRENVTTESAVGSDHILVRLVDSDGNPTVAGRRAVELLERLDDYPVLDDEGYSNMEYETTLDNIKNEAPVALTDGEAAEVYRWLWDNYPQSVENADDKGGYPSREEIAEAVDRISLEDGTYWSKNKEQTIDNFVAEGFDKEEATAAFHWLLENDKDALKVGPPELEWGEGAYAHSSDIERAFKEFYLAKKRQWEKELGQQELW